MKPKIYTEQEHKIDQNSIDPDAMSVVARLKEAGFTSYIVGGGVRDLLLGKTPKDFDISTSAKPEEIKQLFGRRCLLIGRRFRLAHLRFGPKILEVSTFRTGENSASLVVRDNRWGTEEEDVLRRDFTINALFYDPTTQVIFDYVDGYQDLAHKLLRTIGDPHVRFRQDPVRMIRFLKFSARFDFASDHTTERALIDCREEIMKAAPARVLEEVFKMLESGHAAPFFSQLLSRDFLELLFPSFYHFFSGPHGPYAFDYLKAVDTCSLDGKKKFDRAFYLAALVYPILEKELLSLSQDRQAPIPLGEVLHLTTALLRGISTSSFSHFPKRIFSLALAIMVSQFRLTPLRGRRRSMRPFGDEEAFHLAIEFLRLRSIVHDELYSMYLDWKKIGR